MKKLAALLKLLLFSSFLYLIVGLSVHSKIVGEPPTPNYYHNIAVGVIIGSLVVVYLGLTMILKYQPHLIREEFRFFVGLTIPITLLGLILSTGAHGGSFLTPPGFALVAPGNLVVLGIIH